MYVAANGMSLASAVSQSLRNTLQSSLILFQSLSLKLHFKSTIWTQFHKSSFQFSII